MNGMANSHCDVCGESLGIPDGIRHDDLRQCVEFVSLRHAKLVEAARAYIKAKDEDSGYGNAMHALRTALEDEL